MPRILLAPMEGLADNLLRGVLTGIGGYDWGICEFVRVSNSVLPVKTYERICPELLTGGKTAAGTPMRVQLLGSDPHFMAENARRLVTLNPAGVDINFGCPAPTVFRHRGGSALLGEPELLHEIVSAVRAVVDIPLIANGEVWTAEDFRNCQQVSGCADIMLGRGVIADPLLPRKVRGEETGGWAEVVPGVAAYWLGVRHKVVPEHAGGRVKQWLALLRRTYPEAEVLYQTLRPIKTAEGIDAALLAAGVLQERPVLQ